MLTSSSEYYRAEAVRRFLRLEISKEQELQNIVELAAEICHTPIALITLLDENTQHIRFKVGLDIQTTPRADSFCTHAIEQDKIMIVPDSTKDARFENNPLVTDSPNIRFYAGAPFSTHDGLKLGSLCVIDQQPHELTEKQQRMLELLSKQVINIIELELSLKILKDQFKNIEELMQRKDEFIGIAAHELKTPITSVKAFFQLIHTKLSADQSDEKTLTVVSRANNQIDRLVGIVKDLMDVNKLNAKVLELCYSSFPLSDIVKDIVKSFPAPGRLDLQGDWNIEMQADKVRIRQVLQNFVSNAVKYSPEGSKIIVEVSKERTCVKVSVTDFGIGIPDDKVGFVFDRYYRVEHTSKNYSGLGLGLYISKNIIESHKGRMGANSIEGRGSTFWFTLPYSLSD